MSSGVNTMLITDNNLDGRAGVGSVAPLVYRLRMGPDRTAVGDAGPGAATPSSIALMTLAGANATSSASLQFQTYDLDAADGTGCVRLLASSGTVSGTGSTPPIFSFAGVLTTSSPTVSLGVDTVSCNTLSAATAYIAQLTVSSLLGLPSTVNAGSCNVFGDVVAQRVFTMDLQIVDDLTGFSTSCLAALSSAASGCGSCPNPVVSSLTALSANVLSVAAAYVGANVISASIAYLGSTYTNGVAPLDGAALWVGGDSAALLVDTGAAPSTLGFVNPSAPFARRMNVELGAFAPSTLVALVDTCGGFPDVAWFTETVDANQLLCSQLSVTTVITDAAFVNTLVTTSDRRVKRDISDVAEALSIVKALTPVYFSWSVPGRTNLGGAGVPELGFVAQDVEAALPGVVHTTAQGTKALAYDRLTALLTAALKEQAHAADALVARVSSLEASVAVLMGAVRAPALQ